MKHDTTTKATLDETDIQQAVADYASANINAGDFLFDATKVKIFVDGRLLDKQMTITVST